MLDKISSLRGIETFSCYRLTEAVCGPKLDKISSLRGIETITSSTDNKFFKLLDKISSLKGIETSFRAFLYSVLFLVR